MKVDSDLQAIQEVRNLCRAGNSAQEIYANFTQDEVDKVAVAVAEAGFRHSEELAKMAVRETGYGNVADKIKKNQFAARNVFESIRDLRTVGIINEDRKKKILEIAYPMGVVVAIIPTTNPTSTTIFKTLISLKTGNAILISPHPRASKCIRQTANILIDAAIRAGAPEGLIGVITKATLQSTQELMRCSDTAVILATGGSGLVRAAYSAGKPAYGVGPGNVPVYVSRCANIKKAASDIVSGKTFDNSTLCSSEQAIIVDEPIVSRMKEALINEGCYFMQAEESKALAKTILAPTGYVTPEMVGKSAQFLAEKAGIQIPDKARVLVTELQGVGKMYPFSAEKLCPTLAFYRVNGPEEGIRRSVEILQYGGMGHTAAIHCKDDELIRRFSLAAPASRIIVNSPSSMGAVGYTNSLVPSFTLGCGSYGRNITADNLTASHLMNIKRVAYETKPLAAARNNNGWKPNVKHDWRNVDAPYSKALSSDLSRKSKSQPQPADETAMPSKEVRYGSSGMTEAEVDRVITTFLAQK